MISLCVLFDMAQTFHQCIDPMKKGTNLNNILDKHHKRSNVACDLHIKAEKDEVFRWNHSAVRVSSNFDLLINFFHRSDFYLRVKDLMIPKHQ